MSDTGEYRYEDNPTCPYCGEQYIPYHCEGLQFDGDSTIDECEMCGRKYTLTLCVTYEYISDPLPAAPLAAEGKEKENSNG